MDIVEKNNTLQKLTLELSNKEQKRLDEKLHLNRVRFYNMLPQAETVRQFRTAFRNFAEYYA